MESRISVDERVVIRNNTKHDCLNYVVDTKNKDKYVKTGEQPTSISHWYNILFYIVYSENQIHREHY